MVIIYCILALAFIVGFILTSLGMPVEQFLWGLTKVLYAGFWLGISCIAQLAYFFLPDVKDEKGFWGTHLWWVFFLVIAFIHWMIYFRNNSEFFHKRDAADMWRRYARDYPADSFANKDNPLISKEAKAGLKPGATNSQPNTPTTKQRKSRKKPTAQTAPQTPTKP